MKTLNGIHTSGVRGFFDRQPGFRPENHPLLDHHFARRWFDLLRSSATEDVYTFEEVMQGKSGPEVMIGGRQFFMMSSYDYLGLVGQPAIEHAAIEAIRKWGTGTGGVRLLTGTNELHGQLERQIALFKETEAAVLFNSGYMANLAVISALFSSRDAVLIDEYVHRSIVDGLCLAGIKPVAFRHNNPDSLEQLLAAAQPAGRKVIIVEGVYSMDGDICPLPEIVALKERYEALLMIDEAHSLGVLGEMGQGVHAHFNIPAEKIDIFTGSLSKAIPSNGGFAAASEEVILYLRHGSAPFMFSAATTPANTGAALEALRIVKEAQDLREKLWLNVSHLIAALNSRNIRTGNAKGPVVPVMIGDKDKALQISKGLFDRGFIANAVVYPAVPAGKSRLRLCCTAAHEKSVLDHFADTIANLLS